MTLRVWSGHGDDAGVGWLRTRDKYAAIREATITVLKHEDFRIVHVSIQGTHIHLLQPGARRSL